MDRQGNANPTRGYGHLGGRVAATQKSQGVQPVNVKGLAARAPLAECNVPGTAVTKRHSAWHPQLEHEERSVR